MTLSTTQLRYQTIVELHLEGKNQKYISAELEITARTVQNYLSKWRKGEAVEEVKTVGRPSKLTAAVRGSIVAQLEKDGFSTSKDITRAISHDDAPTVTDRTVRNYLAELNYRNSLPRSIPIITDAQKTVRVQWAQNHRQFDWSTVFFSDETMIQLSANLNRAWHKMGHRPSVARAKFPLKVMFWGAISLSRKSPLLVVSGTLNAQGYQALLDQDLTSFPGSDGSTLVD
jgi:transposase